MNYLYLDDLRTPTTDKPWSIVRNFDEFIKYLKINGCPNYISFDHDIASYSDDNKELTGYDAAKILVNMDIEAGGNFIPDNFEYNVHSANPIGKKNIESYLTNYLEKRRFF